MKNKERILFFCLCLFSGLMVSAAGKVQLSVVAPGGGNEVEVGEKFYIYYKLDNISGDPTDPSSIPGSNKLSFSFSSSSSRIVTVNGRTEQSSSRTYVLYARAKAEGNYTFGPVTIGGIKSNSVSYKIVKQRAGSQQLGRQHQSSPSDSPDRSSQNDNKPQFIGKGDSHLFLKASVNKVHVYEQEALEYTVKLYTTYSRIKFIGATESPKFDGFVVEDTKNTSSSFSYETYNGQTYATAVIARYVIFPQKSGKLTVTGNTYTVSADRSEYYSDDFFGSMSVYQPVQLNVRPNDLVVDVKGLPTPIPADFSGGVGQFSISASLPEKKLATNQAASLVYTIKGSGNIKYVKLPELNSLFPAQLEVYSPKTEVDAQVGTSNVSGTVKFDYSVMPLETGNFTIPPVTLVYFNPSSGQYERSTAQSFNVEVVKGKASDKSQTKEKLRFNNNLMQGNDTLEKVHVPYILLWGYWLFYIIPALCLGAVYIIWRKRRALMADEEAFRSRRAGKVATARLKKALACLKKHDEERFFDEMLSALFGYIGDKLKMPTSEITRDNVRSVLENRGISESIIAELISLINECEFAKYSSNGSASDMGSVYDKGCAVINDLEKGFAKPVSSADEPKN